MMISIDMYCIDSSRRIMLQLDTVYTTVDSRRISLTLTKSTALYTYFQTVNSSGSCVTAQHGWRIVYTALFRINQTLYSESGCLLSCHFCSYLLLWPVSIGHCHFLQFISVLMHILTWLTLKKEHSPSHQIGKLSLEALWLLIIWQKQVNC